MNIITEEGCPMEVNFGSSTQITRAQGAEVL